MANFFLRFFEYRKNLKMQNGSVKMNVKCGICGKVFDADIDPYNSYLSFTCKECEFSDIIDELRDAIDTNIQYTLSIFDNIYTVYTNLTYLSRLDIVDNLIPIIQEHGYTLKAIYIYKNNFAIEIE